MHFCDIDNKINIRKDINSRQRILSIYYIRCQCNPDKILMILYRYFLINSALKVNKYVIESSNKIYQSLIQIILHGIGNLLRQI